MHEGVAASGAGDNGPISSTKMFCPLRGEIFMPSGSEGLTRCEAKARLRCRHCPCLWSSTATRRLVCMSPSQQHVALLCTRLAAACTHSCDPRHAGVNDTRRPSIGVEPQMGNHDSRRRGGVRSFVKPAVKSLPSFAGTAAKLAADIVQGSVESCRSPSERALRGGESARIERHCRRPCIVQGSFEYPGYDCLSFTCAKV